MSKARDVDYILDGMRANCIHPGTRLTRLLQERINALDDPVAAKEMFTQRQSMGRLGKPEEIAAAGRVPLARRASACRCRPGRSSLPGA